MRRISILALIVMVALTFTTSLLAGEHATHSCKMAEKACCKEAAECCKAADAACCKEAAACCSDSECCKTAADGTHQCAMKHTDGSACTHTCCKEKSCTPKKS